MGLVESGEVENVPVPQLSINYYKMSSDVKLSDLIRKVRTDEQHHSEVNHRYSKWVKEEKVIYQKDSI